MLLGTPKVQINATGVVVSPQEKFAKLKEAVEKLYYSAHWKSDRLSTEKEEELWMAVRDAAEFPAGNSPKEKLDI